MILRCGCNGGVNRQGALYQDALYGEGFRVHNPLSKADKADAKFRCTVCLTERQKPGKTEPTKNTEKNSNKKLAVGKS